jgi:hypothetical protein
MDLTPKTPPKLQAVLDELMQREPIFHRPEFGTTRAELEKMVDREFREVGASGRRYSRAFVLDTLESRVRQPVEDTWETQDFHCLEVAPNNYLVTYTLLQGERVTRLATIWRRSTKGWKILYHQGTVVEPDD